MSDSKMSLSSAMDVLAGMQNERRKFVENQDKYIVSLKTAEEFEALDLAIKELEKQLLSKIPCDYCVPRKAWEVPNDGIYVYQEVNALGEVTGWSLSVYGGMICFGNAQGRPTYITNCPNCGRKLGVSQ